MNVHGIYEQRLSIERDSSNFLVFIYEGGDHPDSAWSVDSYLLTDAQLPDALTWIGDNAPTNSCWSLGVVTEPARPTVESDLTVAWVIGADVLNRSQRTTGAQKVADEMMARRHRVALP